MLLFACKAMNPSMMLRTPKDYQYDAFPQQPDSSYRIAPNDKLSMQILGDGGELFLNVGRGGGGQAMTYNNLEVLVEYNGMAKIPMLGRVPLEGLTKREAEIYIEDLFEQTQINRPYVTIQVTNRQVIVFPGTGSNAQVVPFARENMNLFEALAQVGGINTLGRADKIKLIRGDFKNPQVYLIDLSTIDGMKHADLSLQANDIIYVEPRKRALELFLQNIQPYLATLTALMSVATTIIVVQTLAN